MCAYETRVIEDDLDHCVDLEDFKHMVMPKLQDQRSQWQEKICKILEMTGYANKQMASLCGVSEQAVFVSSNCDPKRFPKLMKPIASFCISYSWNSRKRWRQPRSATVQGNW